MKYQGSDGRGEAYLDYNIGYFDVFYDDGEISIYMNTGFDNGLVFTVCKDDEEVCNYEFKINKSENLSNGDVVDIYLEKFDSLDFDVVVPLEESKQIKVIGLPSLVKAGNEITKEMIENYLIDSEAFDYSCDANNVDVDVISAVFFKLPQEPGYEEETIVCVDYKALIKTENEIYEQTKLGMIYGPAIKDNKLYADRIDSDLAENMYGPFEDEFKEVGIDIEINDYAQLLKIMQSSDMQKLFDAGLEDPDYVEYVLYCFVNDSTYVIYHK